LAERNQLTAPLSISAAVGLLGEFEPDRYEYYYKRMIGKLIVGADDGSWTYMDGTPGGDALDLLTRFGSFSRAEWIEKINIFLDGSSPEEREFFKPLPPSAAEEDTSFPIDALPPTLRRVCSELSEVHGVPAQFVAAFAMAITGGAAGKGIAAKTWRGMIVYPNIYVLAGMDSGFGKSAVTKPLLAPFLAYERTLQAEHALELPKIEGELALIQKQIAKLLNRQNDE